MIKYTSTDIIKRAEQLADLENSDFISDYEKLALLNESWVMLYQKLINSGDKSFLRSIVVQNGYSLPSDLYQVADIYVERTKELLPKMNAAQFDGYDIKNNKIIISKNYSNRTVILDYYPIPNTLFLKDKIRENPYPDNMIAAYKENYLTSDYRIYNLNDPDTDYSIPVSDLIPGADQAVFTKFEMYKNATVLYLNNSAIIVNMVTGAAFTVDTSDYIPLVRENELFFYSDTLHQVYDIALNIYLEDFNATENIDILEKPSYIYVTPDFVNVYCIYSTGYYINGVGFSLPVIKNRLMYSDNGLYAITNQGTLIRLTDKGIMLVNTEKTPQLFTSDTKMLVRNGLSSVYYLEGIQQDSILCYPNNLYFVMLSYLLAIAFKSKQGSDITQLSAQYNIAENQFFDSISKDANESYTIKNVYRQRGV